MSTTRPKRSTPRKLGSVVWLIEYWSSDVWTVTVRHIDRSWVWLATECLEQVFLQGSPCDISCFRSLEDAETALAGWLLRCSAESSPAPL